MNIYKYLILIKSKDSENFLDKTSEILSFYKLPKKVAITYTTNKKKYFYSSQNVKIFENSKCINNYNYIITVDNLPIYNIKTVLDFNEVVKIIRMNGKNEIYEKSRVRYQKNRIYEKTRTQLRKNDLNNKQIVNIIDYLKGLSKFIDDDLCSDFSILESQYLNKLKINEKNILLTYILGKKIEKKSIKNDLIFPFGVNISQKKAVKKAFENSISVIEGPPGTGKTQTILNIIANIVLEGGNVAVVSGNNSSTSNVQEKLNKNGYGFITALLGSKENKDVFFMNGQIEYPNLTAWSANFDNLLQSKKQLNNTYDKLDSLLEDRNTVAILKEKLSKLKIEQSYFKKNNSKNKDIYPTSYSLRKNFTNNDKLDLIIYLNSKNTSKKKLDFLSKVYLFFRYRIYNFKLLIKNQKAIILSLEKKYYIDKIKELNLEIENLSNKLKKRNYNSLIEESVSLSSKIFRAGLSKKYSNQPRTKFTIMDYKKNNFKNFIKEYPVILSTTHSILNSISDNFVFDYLIIDEASQVDLVSSSLALSCCRNVVIVGDTKQLPQIVNSTLKNKNTILFNKNSIPEHFNYAKFNIMSSLIEYYKDDLPKTLLNEHYRCHPLIIGFCNEKYYDKKLIIMTNKNENKNPIKIYKTVPGNHARKLTDFENQGWYNLRQIEVLRDEVLNNFLDYEKIGIISPYRNHVTETKKNIKISNLEIDTIHKYQGREKDTIIFTTVANKISSFLDDPNLINVAVSRAVKELIVISSDKLFKQHGTNIGDLMRYIEYNSFGSAIINSKKTSVFDILYSEYSKKLVKIMKLNKNVSKYATENIMYGIIDEVLKLSKFNSFKNIVHVPLHTIVNEYSRLTDKESKFARNSWSHVDFLIFNKLDKEPVLAIEVDGFSFHRNNKKQLSRDLIKNSILKKIDLPIIRFATNESNEKNRLIMELDKIIEQSA